MKCEITFEVEPEVTYIYHVVSWDEAMGVGYELARMMGRRAWTVVCDGTISKFEYSKAPTVQFA